MKRRGASSKRKTGLRREPNGRISRDAGTRGQIAQMSADEARSVVVGARMRHLGVSKEQAEWAKMGYFLGRLLEIGKRELAEKDQYETGICQRQHDAGLRYEELRAAFRHIMAGPKPAGAQDLNRVFGRGSDNDNSEYESRIERQYGSARYAIKMVGYGAQHILDMGIDEGILSEAELGVFRETLNALAHHFKV